MYKENKKKFSPWLIEKHFTQAIGNKPVTLNLSNFLATITELNFPEYQQIVPAEISASYKMNQSKGMIYIQKYNTTDFTEYREQLKKEFNLLDVQKSTWFITKNQTSTSTLITFKEKEAARFLDILREQAKIKLYDYYERPISCKNSLNR